MPGKRKNTIAVDPLSLDFGRDKQYYVYLYRDPRPRKNSQPIYVGKGLSKRRRADVHWEDGSHNLLLKRVLNKIKQSGLVPVVEILGWYDDGDDAYKAE